MYFFDGQRLCIDGTGTVNGKALIYALRPDRVKLKKAGVNATQPVQCCACHTDRPHSVYAA